MNDLNENNNVNASEIMTDANVLYQAYLKAKKIVQRKPLFNNILGIIYKISQKRGKN